MAAHTADGTDRVHQGPLPGLEALVDRVCAAAKTPGEKQRARQAPNQGDTPAAAPLKPPRPKPRRYYRRPLPDESAEMAAARVYRRVRELGTREGTTFSMWTARRLADQYGAEQVQRSLQVVESRGNIQNPAGFIVSYLRSEASAARLE